MMDREEKIFFMSSYSNSQHFLNPTNDDDDKLATAKHRLKKNKRKTTKQSLTGSENASNNTSNHLLV